METRTLTSRHPSRPLPLNRRTLLGLLLAGALVWSLVQAGILGQEVVNPGGWSLVLRFLRAGIHPDLSPAFLYRTLDATLVTLAFAVCGTTCSMLLGMVGGVLASEVWWQTVLPPARNRLRRFGGHRAPWLSVRAVLAVPRAIHEIIWGLFFVNILGLDPLTAILAIAIPYGAITAKVFSEILDETPREPLVALLNSGSSPLKAFAYSLIPQAAPNLLSYAFYRFECSIRAATILGIVGAGGLGYEILLSLQSLRYEQMWTLFFGLFLLSGLTDSWSALLRRRSGAASCTDQNLHQASHSKPGAYQRDPVANVSSGIAAGLLVFSFWYVRPDFLKLMAPRTVQLFAGVIRDSFPPDLNAVQITELFALSAQTLAMSILATAGAGSVGMLLSFLAARNVLLPGGMQDSESSGKSRRLWGRVVLWAARGLLLVCRSIPSSVWALILLFVLFPGILPGAIALGLYTLGILGRLMAEVTENLDDRPLRALEAQGASAPQVFLYGVLPRTLPSFVAYTLYRWEVCIRATAVVGLVGAGGLGRLLSEQLSSFDYRGVAATLVFFVGLTFLVDWTSGAVRRTLR